jgi:Protein of unknown function (DUF1524)
VEERVKLPALAAGIAVAMTAAALAVGPAAAPGRVTAPVAASTTHLTTAPSPARLRAAAAKGTNLELRLRHAVRRLPIAEEIRKGYDRDRFRHWIDADGDCQDTRDEVLAAESTVPVSGCDISTGRWESYYDKQVWTDSSDVDIDHMVPLAEAWDSGARRWSSETRERFANDLRDPRPLVAVTDTVNQSKSDQDPATWMPPYGTCKYLRQWVAVKLRWSLEVDRAEKRALRRQATECANTVITVTQAEIGLRTTSGGSAGSGDCQTGYTPCLPPPPPDLDCADVEAMGKAPVKVWGSDPHHLDGDNNGWGCTS